MALATVISSASYALPLQDPNGSKVYAACVHMCAFRSCGAGFYVARAAVARFAVDNAAATLEQ
jgi:hypothetical protein